MVLARTRLLVHQTQLVAQHRLAVAAERSASRRDCGVLRLPLWRRCRSFLLDRDRGLGLLALMRQLDCILGSSTMSWTTVVFLFSSAGCSRPGARLVNAVCARRLVRLVSAACAHAALPNRGRSQLVEAESLRYIVRVGALCGHRHLQVLVGEVAALALLLLTW